MNAQQTERFFYGISRANKIDHMWFPDVAEKISDMLHNDKENMEETIAIAEDFINKTRETVALFFQE